MTSVKKLSRRILSSVMPASVAWYTNVRVQQMTRRCEQIGGLLATEFDSRVNAGPFEGMHYINDAKHSGLCPKLVGCYESEIEHAVEAGLQSKCFVDVGAAEGYYAVGAAYRGSTGRGPTKVVAFDTDDECRQLCEKLAAENGVTDRIDVRATCDHAALEVIGTEYDSMFVLCDCEGYEATLLDPSLAPSLKRCDLLVELHEFASPGVTEMLKHRFETTHRITFIDSVARRAPEPYGLAFLGSRRDQELAVDDLRVHPQQWAWLRRLGT